MSNTLSVVRGTAAWSTSSPKFGTHFLSASVAGSATADTFLSSTGAPGGTLTTGTIEGWVKTTGTGTKVWCGRDGWYWVGMVSGKIEAHYGPSSGEVTLSTTATVNDGAWHHWALVFTAGAGSLYMDGTRVATSATVKTVGTPVQATFTLGGFGDSSFNSFDFPYGGLDEVRISNVARYSGTTYTTPTAAFTDDSSTVALYHLDNDGVDAHVTTGTIAPNDAGFLYSPYNWLVGSTVAETINSGAYFRCVITGTPTTLALLFDVSSTTAPVPVVKWRLDNGGWNTASVAASVPITLPTDNTWTKHNLEVVVKSTTETVNRWNSTRNASVKFLGLSVVPNTCALTTIQPRGIKAIVFGDSITEGVRTLNSTATNDTDRNDATVGWAWRLTENLGAEVGCVGFGGTGLSVTGSGNVPILGTSYASLWSGQARDITTSPPDVIVINIGANDSTTNTVAAGTGLLNNLLSATPATTKIMVMRPFNGTQAANLQSAIAACSNPSRVFYVDTTGWWSSSDSADSLHPYGYTNVASLSPRLAAAIRTALSRGDMYLNIGGVATPVAVTI